MSPKKQFKWSSHKPVIKTLLQVLRPQLIVELGVGNFSTPIFLESDAKKIWHIENDQPWLDHVQAQFSSDTRSEFSFHDLGTGISKSTPWQNLPAPWQQTQTNYYQDLKTRIMTSEMSPRLLFIDHYTCLRLLAINILSEAFDAVIYHDAETPEVYGYQSIHRDLHETFDHYHLRPNSSWTGFLLRRDIAGHDRLQSLLMQECTSFAKLFGRIPDEFQIVKL